MYAITDAVDTLPFTHNMIVVISPMGDQAPPALAAMIIMLAYNQRSLGSLTNLRNNNTITIEVVRLSRIADMKNVTNERIHKSFFLSRDVIRSVMIEKPP